jgi:hypothetical protein
MARNGKILNWFSQDVNCMTTSFSELCTGGKVHRSEFLWGDLFLDEFNTPVTSAKDSYRVENVKTPYKYINIYMNSFI